MPHTFAEVLMLITFTLRKNPMRWFYNDSLLRLFSDPKELSFFEREWGGAVWDVGASVGKYTTVMARHNPENMVYAFEPNLNSLDYLAYRCCRYPNITVVPNALTLEEEIIKGSHDPHFNAESTGPWVPTISLAEALRKFGTPVFIKMDIEGAEYEFFKDPPQALFNTTLLVSWHPHLTGLPIPKLPQWKSEQVAGDTTLLTPLAGH